MTHYKEYNKHNVKDFINSLINPDNYQTLGDLLGDDADIILASRFTAYYNKGLEGVDFETADEELGNRFADEYGNELYTEIGELVDKCDNTAWKHGRNKKYPEDPEEREREIKKAKAITALLPEFEPFLEVDENGKTKKIKKPKISQIELAEAWVTIYADQFSFNTDRKTWGCFDGGRWRFDSKTDQLVRQSVKNLINEIPEKRLSNTSRTSRFITGVLELAATENHHNADDLDQDEYLIAFKDRYVSFRDGKAKYEMPNPARMVSKLVAGNCPIDAQTPPQCPTFLNCLGEWYQGDQRVIDYLQRLFGYALLGLNVEHRIHFLEGGGANGKTTLLSLMMRAFGDYSFSLPARMITEHNPGRFDLTALKGVRLGVLNELSGRLNEDRVKMLTGDDKVSAEYKYGKQFNFHSCATLLVSVNEMPRLTNVDYAIRRRIVIIPMNFRPVTMDTTLSEKLRQEIDGVMLWALNGTAKWIQSGFGELPSKILVRTNEYLDEQDDVQAWINQRCKEGGQTAATELYKDFENWCKTAGIKYPKTQTKFGSGLRRILGDVQFRPSGSKNRHWPLTLIDDPQGDLYDEF